MNLYEKGIRRLGLFTLPPAEAATVTWDFVNDPDVVIPQRCSGDPAHESIEIEKKIPGKRSKKQGGPSAGSQLTQLILFILFGWLALLFTSSEKAETVKLTFPQKMPYCKECYQGIRRTLVVRSILIILTVLSGLALCFSSAFEWGLVPLSLGIIFAVGIVISNMIRNKSNTIRILDFDSMGGSTQVTLRFANPDYAELFVLENNIAALNDPRSKTRTAAAALLGPIGDFRATLPLINTLTDPVADVREAVTKSLLQLNDPQARDALIKSLQNPNQATRVAVVTVLKQLQQDNQTATAFISVLAIDESPQVRLLAAAALAAGGDKGIEPLIRALEDVDADVRAQAAASLGALAATQAVPALIAALEDTAVNVRQEAAAALGTLHNLDALDPLMRLLRDNQAQVAPAAADSLLKPAPNGRYSRPSTR